jgi:MFS family permease
MTFSLVWFTQPYQTQLNMPISYFGFSNAIFMCGMIVASRWAYTLEKRMDDRLLLVITLATKLLCFLVLGLNISEAGLLFLFIGRASYGMMDTLTSDMINRLTTSDRRATVHSIRSFAYNLIFSVFSPLIGYAADIFTLNEAIFMVGIGSAILMIPLAIMLKKSWRELPA